MSSISIWLEGPSRSGKTDRLVHHVCALLPIAPVRLPVQPASLGDVDTSGLGAAMGHGGSPVLPERLAETLVFAATGDNRIDLVERLTRATHGDYPLHSTTPLGFFETEVTLFWSLLVQALDLKAQFPLRLASENEQELATQLWRPELDRAIATVNSVNESRLVRQLLDVLYLAALSGTPIADIPTVLEQGLADPLADLYFSPEHIGVMLEQWQRWCLERGLLTYGIMVSLYEQYLLPHPVYRHQLRQRYRFVVADDVDEYPAIARSLFEVLLEQNINAVFSFNPDGAVRLGLGADPAYLRELAQRCQVETLGEDAVAGLGQTLGAGVVKLVFDPLALVTLPETVQTLQTTSRAELLRRTANLIVEAVTTGQVQPRDVAVIGPGLDAIARYSLTTILMQHSIPVESLHDQRPLNSSPIVRALLTLLTLVYPHLGRLVERDAVAEMLVVLSYPSTGNTLETVEGAEVDRSTPPQPRSALIDAVRAGLIADHCFAPHPDRPRLLPITTFPRWDRLGYQAATAYTAIVNWIELQREQLEQRLIPNALTLLDRAIQQFFLGGGSLPSDQLSALRQLIETAQRYWMIRDRVAPGRGDGSNPLIVSRFIQLLRSGTVTANPYPVRLVGPASNAVTLATVFQYRSSRRAHRWQFWLDAGSSRWLNGVDALFAAPLFLHEWSGRVWSAADTLTSNEQRLRRILLDLLNRSEERLYLCHSDLATNGQEQTGMLLTMIDMATPISR